jgi:hypothetical protein
MKTTWNKHYILRNDDVDDNGGGGDDNSNNQQVGENSSPALSAEISSAIAQGFQSIQGQQQQGPPQLSQEEIDQRLKVYKPTPELSRKFRDALAQEHGTGALQGVLGEMMSGIFGHTNTVAQLIGQKTLMDVDSKYQGVAEHISEQKKSAAKKAFFKSYPALEPFKDIMPAAVQRAGDLTGKNSADVNKALASAAEGLIKQFDPNFTISHAQTGGTNPRPASMSNGGHGGGNAPVKTRSSSIWG